MKIIPFPQQALGKLALIGLLFSSITLTPLYAAELVGKPTAVGGHTAASVSSAHTFYQSQSQASAVPPEAVTTPAEPHAPPQSDSLTENIDEAMDELRSNLHDYDDGNANNFFTNPDVLVPVVAMLLLFGGPVLLVMVLAILHYRSKARRRQNINMNIDKLLAAGRDIPIELLLGEEPGTFKSTTASSEIIYTHSDEMMRKGIKNIGLGTGWLIFLTIFLGIKIGSFGFIYIGLGISQVVIWKLSEARTEPRPLDNLKVRD